MTAIAGFAGFDARALALLDELPGWTAERYGEHRGELTVGLVRPAQQLVAEVADRLEADLTVTARASVSPLHRDLRFAASDAPRYKDHVLMTMWEGPDKRTSPVLWIRVDSRQVGVASGIGFTPDIRTRWRSAVAGPSGARLVSAIDDLRRGRGAEIAGETVKRIPVGYDAGHPRADLLRMTGFQVRSVEPLPGEVTTSDFVPWIAGRLDDLLPIHRWLVGHIAPRRTREESPG